MSSQKRLKNYLPLYNLAKQIRQTGLDEYDHDFYVQLKYINYLTIVVYVSGNLMSLLSDICCGYLIAEIVLSGICFVTILVMINAHRTKNIKQNYWITVMLVIRIIGGLFHYEGTYETTIETHLIFCFSTFFVVDSFAFMLVNISYGSKILIPLFLQFLCCVALLQGIFSRVKWPNTP